MLQHISSIIISDLLGLPQKFIFSQLFVKPGQHYLVYFAENVLHFRAFLLLLLFQSGEATQGYEYV